MNDRRPPHDVDAEQAVLGAMLMSKTALAEVSDLLEARDFHVPANEYVFTALLALDAVGQPCDPITVSRELDRRGQLKRIGGAPYLHTLMAAMITPGNAVYHAQIIREHATRRRLIEVGTRITQMGYTTDDGSDLAEIVDRAQAEAGTLSRADDREQESLTDTFDGLLDGIEHGVSAGLPTGFRDLDQLTQGLQGGQMIVIGARPAIGKTTAGLDLVRHVSILHRIPSGFFSLEMTRRQLVRRAMSAEGRIPLHHLAPGCMTADDWARVAKVRERIVSAPIEIDDFSGLTMMGIRAKARRLVRDKGVRLFVVDYAQLVPTGTTRRVESRQAEVSEVTRGLKLLAKELMVPIVVLAQLNRGAEKHTDRRPVLSDLKDSGSLEQDADIVILLHREDAYEPECPRAGEADFIVAKHRDGPTATITVAFQGHYSRFVDMAES